MPKVTADMTTTLDGYGSGRAQSAERPFGDIDAERLHAWMFEHVDESAEEIAAITAAGAYAFTSPRSSPVGESGCSTAPRESS